MISEVYNCDCMEYMATIPDKFFDLVIADPPYRDMKDNAPQKEMREHGGMRKFGNKPNFKMFDEIKRISKSQIIFGANNFGIPFSGFIAWDKLVRGSDRYSQVELASISQNLGTTSIYCQISCYDKNAKIHPSQKPIDLYAWILKTFLPKIGGSKIFDPMMGSQSSRIAAYKLGYDYWGCELDKDFFEKGCERFEKEIHGIQKLSDGTAIKQLSIFGD